MQMKYAPEIYSQPMHTVYGPKQTSAKGKIRINGTHRDSPKKLNQPLILARIRLRLSPEKASLVEMKTTSNETQPLAANGFWLSVNAKVSQVKVEIKTSEVRT
jgi:hypothetical protein